ANFDFVSIRRTSQQLRLSSEAAQRFGRGLDSELTLPALLRASRLMEDLGGGIRRADIADTYPRPPRPKTLNLQVSEVKRLLGMDLSPDEIVRILSLLAFACTTH